MALVAGSRAELIFDVNGADTSRRQVETVADALRRLNAQSLQRLSSEMGAIDGRISSLQSTMGKLVSYSIAGFSLGALIGKVNGAIDVLGDLDDMAQKTGSSVENLSRLQKVANAFGVEFGTVDAALTKLAKGMAETDDEGSKVQKALAALGVSARDSAGKLRDPAEVMIDAAKALQIYQDGAAKTALINDLLSKSGANLLPYLNDVAENIDEFGAVTKEAAARAAEMQDNLGRLRVKGDEIATTIGLAAAPAVNDLASAVLDVMRNNDQLASSNGADWADDMAVGVARLLDVALLLPRAFSAVASSFKVVAADVAVLVDATPVNMARKLAQGRSPLVELKQSLAERDKTLEDANNKYDVLWNKPANEFEQAMLKRLAARGTNAGTLAPVDDPKKTLNYKPGTDAASDAKKEADAYTALIAAIRAKTVENRREIDIGQELADSQKTRIKLDEDLASGKLKLSKAHRVAIDAALAEQAASETSRKEQLAQTDVTRFIDASTAARTQSAAALVVEYQMYGKSADMREVAMLAVKAEADMEKKLADMRTASLPISDKIRAQLESEKTARVSVEQATLGQSKALAYAAQLANENRRAEAEAIADPQARAQAVLAIDAGVWQERIRLAGEGTEAQKRLQAEYGTWYARHSKESFAEVDLERATQMLQVMESLDDAARQAAAGMEQAFGGVGKAIGGLTTALSGYSRTQLAISAQLAGATKAANGDPGKIAKARVDASKQAAQAQIQSYGDMAGAAKGFFDENSRGYEAMEAAEKTFRAFEMALAIKTMLEKSGIVQAFTSLFVASKATETAATVASVAPDVAASMAKGQASAVAGVANQAGGEQYSAWARMAAMAAVMAGLGFAVGGIGGKDTTAVDRQKATGTGSVLGDADAKSESIAKAIQLSAANSNIELNYTSGMLRALLSIESSLSGLGGILARNGVSGATPAGSIGSMSNLGSAIGSPIKGMPGGEWLGKAYGKVTNAILGGDVTNLDGGITSNVAKVSAIRNGGLNAQSYADMEKEGGMFHSDDNWTDKKNLGAEVSNQFGLVITNIVDSVDQAARLIGVGGDAFTNWLNEFTVGIGKISTKGLTGEEIQKQLEAQFSMIADSFASQAVGGLAQFQKVGEGYFETLVRVANNYANLDAVLNSIGKTFGATGLASIDARERLIELAGGIDELASKTAGFAENFLSEAERLAPVEKYLTEQLTAMGLASLRSRDSFKQHVLGLDLTSEAQRQQYVALMDLQEAFAKVYPEIEGMTASLTDAKSALADAYNAEVDAIGSTIDRMRSFAASLRSVRDSAVLGKLSPLSPEQKYGEAKAQYEAVLKAARGGDESAQANYQGAFTAFLEASRAVFASGAQYQLDFAYAQAATEEAARWAEMQVDAGQAQLAILKAQVSSLIDINKSVLSVRDALLQYTQASAANAAPPVFMAPPVSVNQPYYEREGKTSNAALEAQLSAVRTELAGLRADQRQQTGDIVQAQYGAADESAKSINRNFKAAAYIEERVYPE